jgi:putative PIN family toxin of toxin-antitoxin system
VRLVLDTNTVVSGLLWDNTPSRLIDAGLQGHIELFTSQVLLLEPEDVLPRRKLARRVAASGLSVAQLVARYALLAQSVSPAAIESVSVDPDDDHVLACALAAQVDLIVSGDRHLLTLKTYQGIPVVSPAEALTRLPQR